MSEVAFVRGDLTYRHGLFQRPRYIKNFRFFYMKCRRLLLDVVSDNKEETNRNIVITIQRRTVLLCLYAYSVICQCKEWRTCSRWESNSHTHFWKVQPWQWQEQYIWTSADKQSLQGTGGTTPSFIPDLEVDCQDFCYRWMGWCSHGAELNRYCLQNAIWLGVLCLYWNRDGLG